MKKYSSLNTTFREKKRKEKREIIFITMIKIYDEIMQNK